MRGLPYYLEHEYHEYLLSEARSELFPADAILSQINWDQVHDLLDFGMGNGYFIPHFYRYISTETNVWGAECQEELIDKTLQLKIKTDITNFIPFHVERTEHPLLPEWIPPMDIIFCSCVLSTFTDPSLAIRGIGRSLSTEGRIIIIDWEKKEAPTGPDIEQKVSLERMEYFIEDSEYTISNKLKINEYIYAMEIIKDKIAESGKPESEENNESKAAG